MKLLKKRLRKALPLLFSAVLLLAALLSFVSLGAAHLTPWLILAVAVALPLVPRADRCANFLTWKSEYATGLSAIDDEHKKLLTLLNSLLAAVHCNTGPEFERHALNELVDYTRYHFVREERMMAEQAFPDYEGHKAQHDQMIDRVDRFLKRYEEEGRAVLEEVAEYLRLWLLQHILGTDQKYAPYMRERGLK